MVKFGLKEIINGSYSITFTFHLSLTASKIHHSHFSSPICTTQMDQMINLCLNDNCRKAFDFDQREMWIFCFPSHRHEGDVFRMNEGKKCLQMAL